MNVDAARINEVRRFSRLTGMRAWKARNSQDDHNELYYRRAFSGKRQYFAASIKTNKFVYPIYARYIKNKISQNVELEQLILDLNLDLMVHPTVLDGLFVNDLIEIGNRLNIPTICLMNSWDNPSTKALMMGEPDKLFVWGEQTKNHAKTYLGLTEDRIVISSPAQFEVYKQSPKISRTEYRNQIGADADEKLICYAGSSKGLNEMRHLQEIDDSIAKNRANYQVVYRPHPWKSGHKDEKNFFDYKFKSISMDTFSIENYEAVQRGDSLRTELMNYEYTNVILRSIDGLISPLSTILLEAAMFGIAIAVYTSNDGEDDNTHWGIAASLTQFVEFYDRVQPIFCRDINELWTTVDSLAKQSDNLALREKTKIATKHFVHTSEKSYTDSVIETIEQLTSES